MEMTFSEKELFEFLKVLAHKHAAYSSEMGCRYFVCCDKEDLFSCLRGSGAAFAYLDVLETYFEIPIPEDVKKILKCPYIQKPQLSRISEWLNSLTWEEETQNG